MKNPSRKGFLQMLGGATAITGMAASGATQAATSKTRASIVGGSRATLIRGADLLTMDPKLGEVYGADVLVRNGRIVAIGKGLVAGDAEVIDGKGMILMPGMIDGHRHVWESVHMGAAVKTQHDYSKVYTDNKLKYMTCYKPEDLYLANYYGGLMAIDSGVTSLIDYAHIQYTPELTDASAQGLIDSGIAGWFCWQISHTPLYGPGDTVTIKDAMAQRASLSEPWRWEHLKKMRDGIFSKSPLVNLGVGLSVELNSVDVQRDQITRSRDLGLKMITQHYSTKVLEPGKSGYRGIVDMGPAGLLGPDLHFDHANNLTNEDLKWLADTGGMTCSTPVGEFPYPNPSSHWRARDAGVATGIGTDVPVAFTSDYFETVRGAYWSMYRTPEGAARASTYESEDVLDYATRLGAKGLGLGDEVGTITVGKRADLVLLRTDRMGFAPYGTLATRVVNFAAWADVDSVWIGGIARKRNGRLLGVDVQKLRREQFDANERARRLAETITIIY